jgi:hypothetical protein
MRRSGVIATESRAPQVTTAPPAFMFGDDEPFGSPTRSRNVREQLPMGGGEGTMSRRMIATAIALAFVISALAMPTIGAAASELRAPVLSLDSFTTNKVVGTDGSVSYTFDFSASWTRAQDATLYVLCVTNLEMLSTCWSFTSKGFPDRPGAGVATLSFSATNIPVGYLFLQEGPVLLTQLPFTVQACSPIHGCAFSNTVIGVVDTT